MGILDSKTRIMDTLVTFEGRRQIANGHLKVEWVSLSDSATFYEPDVASGSSDATSRVYFEMCNLPQDEITFRSDENGALLPFRNDKGIALLSGKVFATSGSLFQHNVEKLSSSSFQGDMTLIEDENFSIFADTLLSSSLDNFKKLQMISTIDTIFEDDKFLAGPPTVTFKITDKNPISSISEQSANVTHLPSFFEDKRMLHLDNFRYLPPITKDVPKNIDLEDQEALREFRIGEYGSLGPTSKTNYSDFEEELAVAHRRGNAKVIRFDPTSHTNRIALQFFEIKKNDVMKLEAIDFGTYTTDDPVYPRKKVYFLGKVINDDHNNLTFVHIFTLVME